MYRAYVTNNIDYSGTFTSNNPMVVLLWAIAMMTGNGPCRSGGVDFYRNGDYLYPNSIGTAIEYRRILG